MLGISSPLLAAVPGVSHRFFQRVGGTSPHPWAALNTSFDVRDAPARVEENLARVRFQIGVGRDRLYACTQVHGADIVCVGEADIVDDIRARRADVLVTTTREVAVGVRTADCAPLLVAVDDGTGVAAIHAGWRGAVAGAVAAGVRALCERSGVGPERLVAAVGPTIGIDAFEVGDEVIEAARAACDLEGLVRRGEGARPHLDLAGLCLRLLAGAGVSRAERVGGCTAAEEASYFSHRRDVTWRGGSETGRQMSVIALTTPPMLDDEAFR